jgi:hypothetical protein
VENKSCLFCNDTVAHLFYWCCVSSTLWNEVVSEIVGRLFCNDTVANGGCVRRNIKL